MFLLFSVVPTSKEVEGLPISHVSNSLSLKEFAQLLQEPILINVQCVWNKLGSRHCHTAPDAAYF